VFLHVCVCCLWGLARVVAGLECGVTSGCWWWSGQGGFNWGLCGLEGLRVRLVVLRWFSVVYMARRSKAGMCILGCKVVRLVQCGEMC